MLRTKYKKKQDRLDEIVETIIIFIELARGAHRFLQRQKKLTPKLDARIATEINFALNLLREAFHVTRSYIAHVSAKIKDAPEYTKEVEAMANRLVPGSTNQFQLFGVSDLPKTLTAKDQEKIRDKDIRAGKGLIVKP